MSVTYRCDSCGREQSGVVSSFGCAAIPVGWRRRVLARGGRVVGQQHARSDACAAAPVGQRAAAAAVVDADASPR